VKINNDFIFDKNNSSYSLGMSLTIEALKEIGNEIEYIVLSSKANKNSELDLLLELSNKNNIEIIENDQIIEKYSLKENCYCIGFFKRFKKEISSDKHIVCVDINDYGQLGTILRSAVSFNFKDIILINCDIDVFDPRVIRASMGAIFHVSINKYDSLNDYFNEYKYNQYYFASNGNKELRELNPIVPYSLIVSNENNQFENAYYIKHHGKDSLSLSALSSIVFNYCFENLKR